jgi:hypothetical protein
LKDWEVTVKQIIKSKLDYYNFAVFKWHIQGIFKERLDALIARRKNKDGYLLIYLLQFLHDDALEYQKTLIEQKVEELIDDQRTCKQTAH